MYDTQLEALQTVVGPPPTKEFVKITAAEMAERSKKYENELNETKQKKLPAQIKELCAGYYRDIQDQVEKGKLEVTIFAIKSKFAKPELLAIDKLKEAGFGIIFDDNSEEAGFGIVFDDNSELSTGKRITVSWGLPKPTLIESVKTNLPSKKEANMFLMGLLAGGLIVAFVSLPYALTYS